MTRQSGYKIVIFMEAGISIKIARSGKEPTTNGIGAGRASFRRRAGREARIRLTI
jgi:hypothetical protein